MKSDDKTIPTHQPSTETRSKANPRIPVQAKSGAYACLKWVISEGSDRGTWNLKVPSFPGTQALSKYLHGVLGDPAVIYTRKDIVTAEQWRIGQGVLRALYMLVPGLPD